MTTAIFYDPIFLEHDTGYRHPESSDRLRSIVRGLKERGILEDQRFKILKPHRASIEEISLVHDPHYVRFMEDFCRRGGGIVGTWGGGIVCSSKSFEAACYAVGAALDAVKLSLDGVYPKSFCLVRPPGHHAEYNYPYGFCMFDNIAVAAAYLIRCRGVDRVMIVDLDAHHGNGTQHAFYDSPKVFYISIHQDAIFPGTGSIDELGRGDGEGYTLNIPVPAYTDAEVYLEAIRRIIRPIAEEYKPEIILVSAGFDPYHDDPLTDLGVTLEGFRDIYREVIDLAYICSGRIVFCLEGGYNLECLRIAVASIIALMEGIEYELPKEEVYPPTYLKEEAFSIVERVRRIASSYWGID
ncbi:MAG: histone deacetylase [Candidatus Bathyarchaeota archaeon]|nr:histone deacetylase [Candidatus Bathyarchaeota archaeon]